MTIVDHLFVIALATVVPWLGWRAQRAQTARIRLGEIPDRPALYRETAIGQWGLFAGLAFLWVLQDRPLQDLGFVPPAGAGFLIGVLLAAGVVGYLFYVFHKAKNMRAAEKAEQIKELGDLVPLLPHNGRDLRFFAGLSVTAGIVEETVFRGYLFWYFAPLLPAWGLVLITGIFFGVAHSYQGAKNALRITGIGVAFGALYLVTGSIWLPILLHILADVIQGAALVEICQKKEPPGQLASPAR